MKQVDYSDRAVAMRLMRVSQLRKLCLSLARANAANRQPPPPEKPRD